MPVPARATFQVFYPDALGRTIATADYGTNGGADLTRPATIPDSSLTVRVSRVAYNAAGLACRTTDPSGRTDEKAFDHAGRLVQTLENKSASTANDRNRLTEFEYNVDGKMTKLTCHNPVTGNQVTEWVYGTLLESSEIARADLLAKKIYPDSSGSSDCVEYFYNRLGELTTQRDQAGVEHEYVYDKLGRLLHDRVTNAVQDLQALNLDTQVLRLSRTYDPRGGVATVTSHGSADLESTDIQNQVARTYNDFGQLGAEKQAHGGAVGETTPQVIYAYEDGSANTLRPTKVTYPGPTTPREVRFNYGEGDSVDDVLSRVRGITDSDEAQTVLAAYSYLGAGQPVEVAYPETGVKLTYLKQSGDPDLGDRDPGDPYGGLDRFGRIQDQRWIPTASSSSSSSSSTETALERVQFTYDQAGNIIRRHNLVAPGGQDEVYTYDGLYQLQQLQRGTLNPQPSTLNPVTWQEGFTFDPMGNWTNYQTEANGSPVLNQDRTHNTVNEITGISCGSSASSSSASTVAYDPAGNMTRCPTPASLAPTGGEGQGEGAAFDLTWDAWNRLVKVQQGETVVAEYTYDGLTRRITKTIGTTTRHYYYNAQWQVLEERLGTSTTPDRQWVWGLLRLDDVLLRDRATQSGNERLYALADHLSSRALVNTSGTVVERYDYDAYGHTRVMAADWTGRAESSYAWEIRLHGYRWDGETGLYQVRYRYLHPGLGRWVSRDPIGEVGGTNLFSFVRNQPLLRSDPHGLIAPYSPCEAARLALERAREALEEDPLNAQLGTALLAAETLVKLVCPDPPLPPPPLVVTQPIVCPLPNAGQRPSPIWNLNPTPAPVYEHIPIPPNWISCPVNTPSCLNLGTPQNMAIMGCIVMISVLLIGGLILCPK